MYDLCRIHDIIKNNKDSDEDPLRKEIKGNMQKLFNQLDFLTYDTVVNQKEVCLRLFFKFINDTV